MSDVALKCCSKCKEEKPATTEFFHRKGKEGLQSSCKPCRNTQIRIHSRNFRERHRNSENILNGHNHTSISIDKLAVMKPIIGTWEQCGSCGTAQGNIIGDVDETTNEKYGYLCMKCYRLVRDFGGDLKRMHKAIDYVEKTRLSRVAHKKKPTMP